MDKGVTYLIGASLLCFLIASSMYWSLKANLKTRINFRRDCIYPVPYEMFSKSELKRFRNGAVAADNSDCSRIGKEILQKDGSAVDAAIATTLCLGIYNPMSSGIGGGHFSIIYLKDNNATYSIDAREAAPNRAHPNLFAGSVDASKKGGLAVGVPGEIDGLWRAHQIGGKLPWKELFQPAIKLCEEGFRVSVYLEVLLKVMSKFIYDDDMLMKTYFNKPKNRFYTRNEIVQMPELAKTLRLISEYGPDVIYNGSLTETIVQEINNKGGIFEPNDLREYKAKVKKPIEVRVNDGHRFVTSPPPSSGVIVPFIVNLMNKYTLNESSETSQFLFYHRFLEASKFAFSKRTLLADEYFSNFDDLISELKNEFFLSKTLAKINDDKTFNITYYEPIFEGVNDNGTSHLSIIDSHGNAVALTSSVNLPFGSMFMGPTTGIIYNSQMDDFSTPNAMNHFGLPPAKANYIQPKKRPLSSMTPLLVFDKNDKLKLIVGSSGGSKIPTTVALIAIRAIWQNKDIKQAIDGFRFHHQLFPNLVQVESFKALPIGLQDFLEAKGHTLTCSAIALTAAQGIQINGDGELLAYSDFRKNSAADGF